MAAPLAIDEKKWFDNISYLLNVSKSETFHDSQLFLFFIYSLIISSQAFLQKTKIELKNSHLVQYTKNTFPEKKLEYIKVEGEINFALERFQAYETFFKWIFNINYQIRDISFVFKNLPVYEKITKEQLAKLNEMVLLPLFNGNYSYIKEKINVPILDCVIWHTIEWIPSYCRTSWLSEFPFPPFDKGNKQSQNGDIITALKLYNKIVFEEKIALDIMSSWYGILDQSLQTATGIFFPGMQWLVLQNGSISAGATKDVEKVITNTKEFVAAARDTAADIYQAMLDAAEGAAKAAQRAVDATKSGVDSLMNGLAIAAGAVGTYIVYRALFES